MNKVIYYISNSLFVERSICKDIFFKYPDCVINNVYDSNGLGNEFDS